MAGSVFGAMRDHVATFTSTPSSSASCPRYVPHSQRMIAASTGQVNGLTPSV